MRTIKEINAEAKCIREEARAKIAALKVEAEMVRQAKAEAKAAKQAEKEAKAKAKAEKAKAKAEKPKSKRKAKAQAKPDTHKEQARDLYERATEFMKSMHPDHGGPGGPAFHNALKSYKNAKRAYDMYA